MSFPLFLFTPTVSAETLVYLSHRLGEHCDSRVGDRVPWGPCDEPGAAGGHPLPGAETAVPPALVRATVDAGPGPEFPSYHPYPRQHHTDRQLYSHALHLHEPETPGVGGPKPLSAPASEEQVSLTLLHYDEQFKGERYVLFYGHLTETGNEWIFTPSHMVLQQWRS